MHATVCGHRFRMHLMFTMWPQVWWIGQDGSIHSAVDNDPDRGQAWFPSQIFGPGSAVPGALASVSRTPLTKDVSIYHSCALECI